MSNIKKVRCSWNTKNGEEREKLILGFPESVKFHDAHGTNLAECDSWKCDCGNTPHSEGFHPCDRSGASMEPEPGWPGLYRCDRCDTIYGMGGQERLPE